MVDTDHGHDAAGLGPGAAALLEDWVTIWQSEMAGLVLDRELQDGALRMIDAWAAQARAALRAMAPAIDASQRLSGQPASGAHRPAGPVPAAGAAPAADAPAGPDERDATIRDLLHRVAELERRLAAAPSVQP